MWRELTTKLDMDTKAELISEIQLKVPIKFMKIENNMGKLGGEPRLTEVTVSGRLEETFSSNQIVSNTRTGTSRDSVSHGKDSQTLKLTPKVFGTGRDHYTQVLDIQVLDTDVTEAAKTVGDKVEVKNVKSAVNEANEQRSIVHIVTVKEFTAMEVTEENRTDIAKIKNLSDKTDVYDDIMIRKL